MKSPLKAGSPGITWRRTFRNVSFFFPILNRSRFMRGRKSYRKRFSHMGVAILLFAGLSHFQPFSPRTVRAGDRREAKPITPVLVTAIRDGDVQTVRKLI